ncbi:MAG: alanine racemase [Bacteroidia bacterium]|nr:alanine racemase [Bacteroidia bacterium]
MAELIIYKNKIQHNIKTLSHYFSERNIKWSLITKVFSGDMEFLKNILTDEIIQHIDSVGDSRLTSLKNLRSLNPGIRTIYIKPPAKIYADEIVKYADITLNSSLDTVFALNEAAAKINIVHQIIIMIELGELREGIMRENVVRFYEKVFELPNIEVIGLGSNLGCMYGVEPTYDKLLQLVLYKELISAKFNKNLPLISGGSSITLPLIEKGMVPEEINHFRIGEAAFFGITPSNDSPFRDLIIDTFEFSANIIEIEQKKIVPDGVLSDANIGHTADFDEANSSETSIKAILDFGLLDVDINDLEFIDKSIHFVGVTSDMLVVDLGENRNPKGEKKYRIGEKLTFKLNYMATARLLNSKFIDKIFLD